MLTVLCRYKPSKVVSGNSIKEFMYILFQCPFNAHIVGFLLQCFSYGQLNDPSCHLWSRILSTYANAEAHFLVNLGLFAYTFL